MSSSIGIGFVFEKHQKIDLLFSEFLSYLIIKGKLQKITYSLDENGKQWHEETIKAYPTCEVVPLLINHFFGKINIKAMIIDDKEMDFDISVFKFPKGDFAFLIEIEIDQLFKAGNKQELEYCSSMIIKFCKDVFDKVNYRYAFCDHEVDIEYTWSEFSKMNESIYSISIVPQNEGFKVNLASWEIDGLTNRYS